MAEADELQCLGAAQLLIAGLQVDAGVVGLRGVVDVPVVDVAVDAAERIDEIGEALEVEVDGVVDLQAREHLRLEDPHEQACASDAVDRIELGGHEGAALRNPDLEIPGHRKYVDRGSGRVETDEQHRVGIRVLVGLAGAVV